MPRLAGLSSLELNPAAVPAGAIRDIAGGVNVAIVLPGRCARRGRAGAAGRRARAGRARAFRGERAPRGRVVHRPCARGGCRRSANASGRADAQGEDAHGDSGAETVIPVLSPPPPANVVWFDELDSTNIVRRTSGGSLADGRGGPLPETLVLRRGQSAGRGRGSQRLGVAGGRALRQLARARCPSRALPLLPMAVGVSLAEAVETLIPGVRVGLKWPNDLQVGGRKLGGVLCRSRGGGDRVWATGWVRRSTWRPTRSSPPAIPAPGLARVARLRR